MRNKLISNNENKRITTKKNSNKFGEFISHPHKMKRKMTLNLTTYIDQKIYIYIYIFVQF